MAREMDPAEVVATIRRSTEVSQGPWPPAAVSGALVGHHWSTSGAL